MRALFRLFASLSLAAAVYHVIGLFIPVSGSHPLRHTLFAVIDLCSAYGFLRRPRWFIWAFAVLAVQQCSSHGGAFLLKLDVPSISWMDLGVVLFMVLSLACLIMSGHREAK